MFYSPEGTAKAHGNPIKSGVGTLDESLEIALLAIRVAGGVHATWLFCQVRILLFVGELWTRWVPSSASSYTA